MKFTYTKRSNGSNTVVCGTPDLTGMEKIGVPNTDRDIVRPIRKFLINEIMIGSKPNNCRWPRKKNDEKLKKKNL